MHLPSHTTNSFGKPKNMGKLAASKTLFFSFFFFVLVLHSCPATSQEVEDEREFDYNEQSGKGPDRWGEIRPEWDICRNGTMQSPIDLSDEKVEVVSNLGRLARDYKPARAIVRNRGHDMMLKWEEGGGSIRLNGTDYVLRQCHWHSPSEHTVNGRRYDLEVHMVHESPTGLVTVVGILYKIGQPDSFLSLLTNHLAAVADYTDEQAVVGVVDPKKIKIGSRKYYRYIGSLTVPPCTQNVVWTIVKKIRTVTREQIRLLRVAVHDDSETNARPIQPINTRSVKLYRPVDPQ